MRMTVWPACIMSVYCRCLVPTVVVVGASDALELRSWMADSRHVCAGN